MKYRTGNEIRQLFLDYFESKDHKIEPGHSLIPNEDPTLLWINSGVAALKKYFDGSIKPEKSRFANAQKSIRTNDIENVGLTARHHTFFEMLGNFSIGDYFKKEAIDFAWEFFTDEKYIGFDKDKLYITVHDHDEEAYDYWVNVKKVDPSHMLKTADNFWQIGEGPCGPNSEIFYDRGEKYDPEGVGIKLFYEELENDRYVEIWNLVFSEYNAKDGVRREDYEELPQKNIDTGMGLERLVSVIQDGETNFDTDFFLPIIQQVEKLAKVSYQENKMAYRVIADHIRTVTFALSDGAMFDNVGRGYVLRRILRRAIRYGKQIGIDKAFMFTLVQIVSDVMKEFYDYLPKKVDYVSELVKREEEAFHKTLSNGEKLLSSVIEKNTDGIISGSDAFKLYDTYGFPIELTIEIAKEQDLKVDEEGFKEELQKQQIRSRTQRDDVESMSSQKIDLMNFDQESTFTYDPSLITATVIGVFKDGESANELTNEGEIILDQTTFYAEMGGQSADTGMMYNDTTQVSIKNVVKAPNGQHLHYVTVKKGTIKKGDQLTLEIDIKKRSRIMSNHSATHLLQQALKDVVGTHITQAGSYVDDQRLRFDFTHYEKVSRQQLDEVEKIVNQKVFEGINVIVENMDITQAKEKGALALFTEKYGETVRVVDMGGYSIELCGGCHVTNTSHIGLVKIMSEESIGSGIRRIEAVSGNLAYITLKAKEETLEEVASLIKASSLTSIKEKATSLIEELQELRKNNKELLQKINSLQAKASLDNVKEINGTNLLVVKTYNKDQASSKQLVFDYRDQLKSGIIVLLSQNQDNLAYYVAVTNDVVSKGIKAGEIVKTINQVTSGRGGGKPDFAQGGSKEMADVDSIISVIEESL